MTDYRGGVSAPARHIFAVVPSDNNALDPMPKAIRAAADGTITLRAVDSDADVAHPVYAGEIILGIISHVRATGTDVAVIGYA